MTETVKQVKEQYKNSKNLDTRIGIHELYSTNKQDWHLWLMEQYHIPDNATILELGCGSGVFWQKNKSELEDNWNITLSDFSQGMLDNAKDHVGDLANVDYKQVNIMEIPFPENSFDIVIANHMLYHVPDVQQALSEVRRVLKPNGTFYCSTIGEKHMSELNTWLTQLDSRYDYVSAQKHASQFGLENGEEQLKKFFTSIELKPFEGGLEVTEAGPLAQYIFSAKSFSEDEKKLITAYFEDLLKQESRKLSITKATGLFIAK